MAPGGGGDGGGGGVAVPKAKGKARARSRSPAGGDGGGGGGDGGKQGKGKGKGKVIKVVTPTGHKYTLVVDEHETIDAIKDRLSRRGVDIGGMQACTSLPSWKDPGARFRTTTSMQSPHSIW